MDSTYIIIFFGIFLSIMEFFVNNKIHLGFLIGVIVLRWNGFIRDWALNAIILFGTCYYTARFFTSFVNFLKDQEQKQFLKEKKKL